MYERPAAIGCGAFFAVRASLVPPLVFNLNGSAAFSARAAHFLREISGRVLKSPPVYDIL